MSRFIRMCWRRAGRLRARMRRVHMEVRRLPVFSGENVFTLLHMIASALDMSKSAAVVVTVAAAAVASLAGWLLLRNLRPEGKNMAVGTTRFELPQHVFVSAGSAQNAFRSQSPCCVG